MQLFLEAKGNGLLGLAPTTRGQKCLPCFSTKSCKDGTFKLGTKIQN